ncbi:hypothetical protein [Marinobacterium aestuariivivens]|uniref:Pilus assembly protein PilZ n=1 Tax=Marinobacterium aestuariivivens TaxID=1698799 RepID=A0ABW2A2R9_9GAMM
MSNLQLFIRHPDEIPLDLEVVERPLAPDATAMPLGLVCRSLAQLECGQQVSISAHGMIYCPNITGRIDWCHPGRGGYELGILFANGEHAMRMRMFEQVCHIRRYRLRMREEQGRLLSEDEAALEWIAKYAALFPANDL